MTDTARGTSAGGSAAATASLFGAVDLHLFNEGSHERIYEKLGSHRVEGGVHFAVWAPNARAVSVVGDFNNWDGRENPLRPLQSSGIWTGVVPNLADGELYKYEIKDPAGNLLLKTDPYAVFTEVPPGTASRVYSSRYEWNDSAWLEERARRDPLRQPLSVYEV